MVYLRQMLIGCFVIWVDSGFVGGGSRFCSQFAGPLLILRSMNGSDSTTRRRVLVAIVGCLSLLAGCSDLSLEPDRNPASLVLTPLEPVLTEGETAPLHATVLDQYGQAFSSIPSWAAPRWSVAPHLVLAISADGEIEALLPGEVVVRSRVAGFEASTTVRVNPTEVGVETPVVYMTQSTQRQDGTVPLVADRSALLRVFVKADRLNYFLPDIRVSFFVDGTPVQTIVIEPRPRSIPQDVDESELRLSYNAPIPGSLITAGLEIELEIDSKNEIPFTAGSLRRIPETGRIALDVREAPPFRLRLIPVRQTLTGRTGDVLNVTAGSDLLAFTQAIFPIAELDVDVREPYSTAADLTTKGGWGQFIREIRLLRIAEGSDRYYYGAVELPPQSAWGGLGYVGYGVAVGRASDRTLAHELGHNFSLRHAPCGDPSGPDQNYPYGGASIGRWGYDYTNEELQDPASVVDVMSYCGPKWISDYHFEKVMAYRDEHDWPAGVPSRQLEDALVLWGSVTEGSLLLEPAIRLPLPAALPAREGPYLLEGLSDSGATVFSLRFAPAQTDHDGRRHFVFSLPIDPVTAEGLERIRLSGPEGRVEVGRAAAGQALTVVTDAASGLIKSISREQNPQLLLSSDVAVRVSDGVRTRTLGVRQ